MPFVISLAAELQFELEEKLAGLEGVEIIRDNILTVGYGESKEDAERNHDENMIKMLQRAKEVNLTLNCKEIKLGSTSVKFMGHVICKDGPTSDPDKVKAVQDMPKTREACSFVLTTSNFNCIGSGFPL